MTIPLSRFSKFAERVLLVFGKPRQLVFLIAVACALCALYPVGAVPAAPDGLEVTQPDGKTFRLHVRGDEFFSWNESAEGYTVLRDAAVGFWKNALEFL